MAIIATDSGSTFTPCPQGVHQGVAVDVVDHGFIEVTFSGQTKRQHKVSIVWLVDELNDDGKPFMVQKRYTNSLNERATLRADLQSWRGKPFTADELKGFDLEKLIGANAQLNVQHVVREGKTYANVTAIMPLARGMAKLPIPGDYIRRKDRQVEVAPVENGGPDVDTFIDDSSVPF